MDQLMNRITEIEQKVSTETTNLWETINVLKNDINTVQQMLQRTQAENRVLRQRLQQVTKNQFHLHNSPM